MDLNHRQLKEKDSIKHDLVDVTAMAKSAGIEMKTVMTRAAWKSAVDVAHHNVLNRSIANQLWDVMVLLFLAIESKHTKYDSIDTHFHVAVLLNGISTEIALKAETQEANGEILLMVNVI